MAGWKPTVSTRYGFADAINDSTTTRRRILRPRIDVPLGARVGGEPYRGHDGIRQYFEDIESAWDEWRVEVDRVEEGSDGRAAIVMTMHWRGKESGTATAIAPVTGRSGTGGSCATSLVAPDGEEEITAACATTTGSPTPGPRPSATRRSDAPGGPRGRPARARRGQFDRREPPLPGCAARLSRRATGQAAGRSWRPRWPRATTSGGARPRARRPRSPTFVAALGLILALASMWGGDPAEARRGSWPDGTDGQHPVRGFSKPSTDSTPTPRSPSAIRRSSSCRLP